MGIGLALIWLGRGMILDLCARVTGFWAYLCGLSASGRGPGVAPDAREGE